MKAYLVYDRYGSDEWFEVYHVIDPSIKLEYVDTRVESAMEDFIMSGPDDQHSFQCQLVDITPEQFEMLKDVSIGEGEKREHSDSFTMPHQCYELLCELYAQMNDENCVININGIDEAEEVFELYMKEKHPDVEKGSDEWFDQQIEFYGDDGAFADYTADYVFGTFDNIDLGNYAYNEGLKK